MSSIPIPEDKAVKIRFADLKGAEGETIRSSLRRHNPDHRIHLDPDIRPSIRPTPHQGTTGFYGQDGSFQTELENCGVSKSNNHALFLFFGWFKGVERCNPRRSTRITEELWTQHQHVIWGWLQSDGAPLRVDQNLENLLQRAPYHPHVEALEGRTNNVVYVSSEKLTFRDDLSGSGVFTHFDPKLRLTSRAEWRRRSQWTLPAFFQQMACGRATKAEWTPSGSDVGFRFQGYGQEFVFETSGYEREVGDWLSDLFRRGE